MSEFKSQWEDIIQSTGISSDYAGFEYVWDLIEMSISVSKVLVDYTYSEDLFDPPIVNT